MVTASGSSRTVSGVLGPLRIREQLSLLWGEMAPRCWESANSSPTPLLLKGLSRSPGEVFGCLADSEAQKVRGLLVLVRVLVFGAFWGGGEGFLLCLVGFCVWIVLGVFCWWFLSPCPLLKLAVCFRNSS